MEVTSLQPSNSWFSYLNHISNVTNKKGSNAANCKYLKTNFNILTEISNKINDAKMFNC